MHRSRSSSRSPPPRLSSNCWTLSRAGELLLLIKTPADRYPALEQALRALHPYEVPEIVAVPIERGHEDYLEWVRSCTDVS